MLNWTVDVLIQGWQPKAVCWYRSWSMSRVTWQSGSYMRPRTVTEPGVRWSSRSMSSGPLKERRLEPIWAERSLVLKGLLPGMSRR